MSSCGVLKRISSDCIYVVIDPSMKRVHENYDGNNRGINGPQLEMNLFDHTAGNITNFMREILVNATDN